jgi:putative endonuclease
LHDHCMAAWVYIMADRKHGVIYVGVTSDLIKRVVQHKDGTFKGFTHKYSVHRLVYFEPHATMPLAI